MRWWWSPLAIHAPWWPLHRHPVRRRAPRRVPRRPPAVHTYRRRAVASWKRECVAHGIEWRSRWKVIICRSAWMRPAIRWICRRRSTERWGELYRLSGLSMRSKEQFNNSEYYRMVVLITPNTSMKNHSIKFFPHVLHIFTNHILLT